MLSVSQRGLSMPESPIRKLTPYAERAKQKGVKIYHLNIGQPDIKTSKIVTDTIKNLEIDMLPYTQSEGLSSLRESWVSYYSKHKIEVSENDILVTVGASEAILFLINIITDVGDEIIIPEPFYANYLGFATISETNIKPVNASIKKNTVITHPSIDDFEREITPKTKAIMICNPGNPTGYLYDKKEVLELARIAKKHDLYLIADEVYREFVYDSMSHYSILRVKDFEDNAVLIDSVSKRYSLCGVRIGCVVTKNKILMSHLLKLAQTRLCPPIYGQIAAQAALTVEASYYKNIVGEYSKRRDLLVHELNKIPFVEVSIPKGAFYCVASLPVENADNFAQWLLEEFTYNNRTVMLSPMSGFYITPKKGLNQARIAYVLNRKDLKSAIQTLKKALEVYNNSN